jgi:hypothetical protein
LTRHGEGTLQGFKRGHGSYLGNARARC